MKITRSQLRSIIKEAVSIDVVAALRLTQEDLIDMFHEASRRGQKPQGKWYETAFSVEYLPGRAVKILEPDNDPIWEGSAVEGQAYVDELNAMYGDWLKESGLTEIKEAVSVERLKALEGRPHKIDLDSILPADKRKEMFQDAYAEGKKAEGRWYETAFGVSESPDSDPDDPSWDVAGPYNILVAEYEDQKEAEAVGDALNAAYADYLETQDMGDFGFAVPDYTPADHAS